MTQARPKSPRHPRRERHDAWNATRRERFLCTLAQTANVSAAVRAAGKSRTTAYALKRRDPEFAAAWEDALEESMDDLFGLMMHRARDGSTRTISEAGKPVKTIHDYSDRLGMFLLQRYRPTLHEKLALTRAHAAAEAEAAKPKAAPSFMETMREEIDMCTALANAYHGAPG